MRKGIGINSLMTKEQKVLRALLCESLSGLTFEEDEGIDWESVFDESKKQAVTLVAFKNYQSIASISEQLREKLNKYITISFMQNVKVRKNHGYLHGLMTEAGIGYCILKGTASGHYYPEPILRAMGDVDFYINSEDVESVKNLLLEKGFVIDKLNNGDRGHHIVFRNNGKHLELHLDVAGIPESKVGEIIRAYFDDIVDCSSETKEEYVTYINPSMFHHGLVMLLHMQHHMISEGIGLRHLCDWAVFVNHFKGNEFSDVFKDKLKRVGLWDFARIISITASVYLKMPEQPWMYEDESDIEKAIGILMDILTGGNFGRKIKSRKYEGMLISVSGRDGKKKNKISRSFESLNKVVKAHWPIVKKVPILYPIGWIFFLLRLFIMIALGKRPNIRLLSSLKGSDRRSKLYASLKLFEPDDQ